MVEDYKNKYVSNISSFIKSNIDSDFYVVKDNHRKLINDDKTLSLFLKKGKYIRFIIDKGDVLGIVGIWKEIENNIEKEYVKINAMDKDIFEKLIVVAIWNVKNNLLIKIKKNHKFINILRNKGFDFLSSNENEIILLYSKYKKRD